MDKLWIWMEISYIDFNNALLLLYLCHSQPIRYITKTNHLVACVFPHCRQCGCLYFKFSLSLKNTFLSFWLAAVITLVLGLQHSIKKHSTIDKLHLKLCPSEGELGKCWLLMQAFIVNVNLGVTTLFVLIAMYLCLYDNQCLVYRKLFNIVKLYLQD